MARAHSKRGRETGRRRAGRRPIVALVIDAVYPYHWGGRESRISEYSKRISSHADLHIFTMHWWPGPRVITDGAVTYHAVSRLIPMYTKDRRSISQAILFALACFRLFSADFDVLEADHMPYFQILVLRMVATCKRKRFVVTWHEVWGSAYWRQYLGAAGVGAWFVERLAMRLPDHIIAASPETAERLRAALGARASISVAPNGIDLETIRRTPADLSRTDIVVVGRLIAHKRVDMVLEAISRLCLEGFPLSCRIIGDGPDREMLHSQAERLGLGSAVDFRHDVREQKDLFALLKAAKVFVSASEREGFGIAVLEALACGVPVVTTSAPDNLASKLVARSGRGTICEPSAAALAGAIREVLSADSPEQAQHDARDAWIDEYSWDGMTAEVLAALRL